MHLRWLIYRMATSRVCVFAIFAAVMLGIGWVIRGGVIAFGPWFAVAFLAALVPVGIYFDKRDGIY